MTTVMGSTYIKIALGFEKCSYEQWKYIMSFDFSVLMAVIIIIRGLTECLHPNYFEVIMFDNKSDLLSL